MGIAKTIIGAKLGYQKHKGNMCNLVDIMNMLMQKYKYLKP